MTSTIDALILAAMPEEADAVASLLHCTADAPHPFVGSERIRVRRSTGGTNDVAVVTTGIGTASATSVGTWAITAMQPRLVISAGTCGGLADDVAVGTVVIGTEYAYSIADATAFGYEVGQVPGAPVRFTDPRITPQLVTTLESRIAAGGLTCRSGLMVSGDAFVTEPIVEPMRAKFGGAVSADMETTAIAHACHLLGVPFLALRAVSDLCSPRAGEEFHMGLDIAATHSAQAAEQALPLLLDAVR